MADTAHPKDHSIDIEALESPVFEGLEAIRRGLKHLIDTSNMPDIDKDGASDGLTRAIFRYEKVYGTRIFPNPSPDASMFIKTYRGGILLCKNGEIKTSELMVYPDYDLFEADEAERAAVFAETKWTNRGAFIRDQHVRTRVTSRKTILDGDGFGLSSPKMRNSMFRSLGFLLSSELKDISDIPFLDKPGYAMHAELRARDSIIGLARITRRLSADALDPSHPPELPKPVTEWHKQSISDAIADRLIEDVDVYVRSIKCLRENLDSDIVRLMDLVNDTTVKGYNWLCGFDIPEKIRDEAGNLVDNRNREGALLRNEVSKCRRFNVEKYPLAYKEIKQVYGDINDAIKDGQDVTDSLAAHYKITPERMAQFEGIGPNDFYDVGKVIDVARFYKEAKTPEDGARMTSESIARSYLEGDLADKLRELTRWSSGENITVPLRSDGSVATKEGNNQIRMAIERVGIVSNYLCCVMTDPMVKLGEPRCDLKTIVAGRDGVRASNVSEGAYGMLMLTHNATVSEFCKRVNDLYDTLYSINDRIVRDNPLPRYRLDMSWSSVFGKDVAHFHSPDGVSMRPLLSKREIDAVEREHQIVIPGATAISYMTISQYAVALDENENEVGVVRVFPENPISVDKAQTADTADTGVIFPSRFSLIASFDGYDAEDVANACWSINDALSNQYDIMDRAEIINLKADASSRVREAKEAMEGKYALKLLCGYNPIPINVMKVTNLLAPYIGISEKVQSFPDAVMRIGAMLHDVSEKIRESGRQSGRQTEHDHEEENESEGTGAQLRPRPSYEF